MYRNATCATNAGNYFFHAVMVKKLEYSGQMTSLRGEMRNNLKPQKHPFGPSTPQRRLSSCPGYGLARSGLQYEIYQKAEGLPKGPFFNIYNCKLETGICIGTIDRAMEACNQEIGDIMCKKK